MANVCEIPKKNASEKDIDEILTEYRVIAVVGASDKPDRESYKVAKYLHEHGYRVIPVNPNISSLFGLRAYPSLNEVPERVEVVDIFRKPETVPEIVEEAIRKGAKVIWMQKGIVHNAAAETAKKHGLKVVMDRCMMVEHMERAKKESSSRS
ncbi:MAG: CoA-binding protein [Thermoplasmata archaeon]|nr:CoA-binding protein [Thermoplasmata archaeon]